MYISGNEEGRFDITEESGVLFTTAFLDRELRSSYLLSIQARDSATANRLSSVIQVPFWFVNLYQIIIYYLINFDDYS